MLFGWTNGPNRPLASLGDGEEKKDRKNESMAAASVGNKIPGGYRTHFFGVVCNGRDDNVFIWSGWVKNGRFTGPRPGRMTAIHLRQMGTCHRLQHQRPAYTDASAVGAYPYI